MKEELAVAVQTTRVMCPRRSGNGRKQELGASKNPGIAQGKEDPSSNSTTEIQGKKAT